MTKIIIADNPLNEISIAQDLLPPSLDATVAKHGSPAFDAALADAECLVGFGDGTMDDAFYKRAPKLKLVQLLSAGYDRVDIEAARRAGVPVCNNGGANSSRASCYQGNFSLQSFFHADFSYLKTLPPRRRPRAARHR